MAQLVKDLTLSLMWLWLQLCQGFNRWPANFCWCNQKKKKKKEKNEISLNQSFCQRDTICSGKFWSPTNITIKHLINIVEKVLKYQGTLCIIDIIINAKYLPY